jgi:hypothetical protein
MALPTARRSNKCGSIASRRRGSITSEIARLRMMTSWIAWSAGTRSRKNGTASTAKPKPLVACSTAATKHVAANPVQANRAIR